MTQSSWNEAAVETRELAGRLEPLLNGDLATPLRIVDIRRSESSFASSYRLEELVVVCDKGQRFELILKDTSRAALSEAARLAKPEFLIDPRREILVYERLLDGLPLGTARYYGSLQDEQRGRSWLVLEHVAGEQLSTVGDFEIWRQTARWLARFHCCVARPHPASHHAQCLIQYDAAFYHRWLERALEFSSGASRGDSSSTAADFLRRVKREQPRWVDDLLKLPRIVIHGEFYASNIIVDAGRPSPRICPVDWEQAAFGPSLVDLAALTSGNWNEKQRNALAREYFQESAQHGTRQPDWNSFMRVVELCRLHLAIQWLGWSSNWSPPAAHRQDWLVVAYDTFCRLHSN